MGKQDAMETKQISLTIPLKWYGELSIIANRCGLTVQDVIKQRLGEYLHLLPAGTPEATTT